MGLLEAIILAVLAASTPLLLAATGELITERAGVLNLGVEGMMIMGAACGFGGALWSGSIFVGALCGIAAGVALSLVNFGIDEYVNPRLRSAGERARAMKKKGLNVNDTVTVVRTTPQNEER